MAKNCFLCRRFSCCGTRIKRVRELLAAGDEQNLKFIHTDLPWECGRKYREYGLMINKRADAELLRGIINGKIAAIKPTGAVSELQKTLMLAAKDRKIVVISIFNLNHNHPDYDSYSVQGVYDDMEQARISTAGMRVAFIDPSTIFRF